MGKQVRYTPEYKMKTVQMYLHGDLSANQLALNLGIHPHTVRHWIGDYNDGKLKFTTSFDNESSACSNRVALEQQETSKRPDIGVLFSKISVLEFELKELKAMLQAYLIKW